MPLLPREHGAYGQIAFPLIAAFAVSGPSIAGVCLAVTMCTTFLAHEPGLVLLGLRGPRARRELGMRAAWWLGTCALIAFAAGLVAFIAIGPGQRWAIAVPLLPALALAIAAVRGREKSWYGEVAAALAFSGAAVPIALAGGAPLATAAAIAIPFAALFVLSTLAVRIVILRVRRGGDLRETSATRRATLLLAVGGGAALGLAAALDLVPPSVPMAVAPGLLTAAAIALRPPPAAHLRTLGWTLVAISLLTTAIVVTTT
jgi:YwiC-like protein